MSDGVGIIPQQLCVHMSSEVLQQKQTSQALCCLAQMSPDCQHQSSQSQDFNLWCNQEPESDTRLMNRELTLELEL